jgi:hypothetical protein
MNIDLLNSANRKMILDEINTNENKLRKTESYIDFEIYNDRIHDYVFNDIAKQSSQKTAEAMPIISTINVGKRVVDNEATIYNNDPVRTFEGASDSEVEVMKTVYEHAMINSKLQKANKNFKYRNQAFLQPLIKDKSVQVRVLLSHHIDVIPDFEDPEKPYALITSSFDRSLMPIKGDGFNQSIAENEDYKLKERYVVWTAEYNFIMNGMGDYITQPVPNPIGMLPFVDISKDKDYEFFVRTGMNLSNFTVQYNSIWSDFFYIMRMQGFAIPVFTGNPKLMPKEYFVGPNRGIMLPSDPTNPDGSLKMEFLSPNPNLDGSLKGIASFLANWLTSRGVSPKVISSELNAADSYSSGVERLLSMIDKFEATKEDFDLFRSVEQKLFKVIQKYLVEFSNTPFLDPKYSVNKSFENAEINVQFHRPEMIQTEAEQLLNEQSKIELGISDRILALMKLESLTEEQALEKVLNIIKRKVLLTSALAPVENTDDETQT